MAVSILKIFIEISKIKLELISIMKKCGISNISNAIYLITGKLMNDIFDNQFCQKNIETCQKLNFSTIVLILYQLIFIHLRQT